MKSILIFILSIAAVQISYAQSEQQDVIYVNDGSVFRGEIVKVNEDRSFGLKIKNDQIIHLAADEIQKVVQEPYFTGERERGYQFQEQGLYFVSDFTPTFGESSWGESIMGIGVHQVAGYQMHRFLGLGIGFGLDTYEVGNGRYFLPLYIQARGYFRKRSISPYYVIDFGYGFVNTIDEGENESSKGGRYLYPALGYRFGDSENGSFTLDFGVKFQKAIFENSWWGGGDERKVDFQRFALRFGYLF